jgi:predicted O-linked N-acetylglucosamine transferase (SPINDLY family)
MADPAIEAALQHHRAGRLVEAEAGYRKLLAANPNHAEALNLLGLVGLQVGRHADAIQLLERAVRARPEHTGARDNLARAHFQIGLLAHKAGRFTEAADHNRRVLELVPTNAEAHYNLASALGPIGDPAEVAAQFAEAARLKPDLSIAQHKLVHAYHFVPGADAKVSLERHRAWARRFADPLTGAATQPHANSRDPRRRLRVGYVSPDFRRHSVAYFFEPLLASRDKSQVEVFCYADEIKRDETTDRLRAHADFWRPITGKSDEDVAALVRADAIDVLIDLNGHLDNNRLLTFARRPAPVQVTYLGYPDTTGMAAMDYRLSDFVADPPGLADELHTERLVRLPNCAWCYRPDDRAPTPARSAGDGRTTFGCFNSAKKINAPLIALWAKLLRAAPESRLIIKDGQGTPSPAAPRILGEFQRHGLADRVELLDFTLDPTAHLATYNRIDVALDTFPYHGTTTTCEALWMGVPVVTLLGDRHLSRVGASLLRAVGLPDLIAQTAEEYVSIAARIAGERRDCAALREQMRTSPLMDATRFARDVEAAYREMWTRWCAGDDHARG